MTTFEKLSNDVHERLGFALRLRDEWRIYTHDLEVEIHDGAWLYNALQLSVEPARGRRPARIGASLVIDGTPRHFTIQPDHAKELVSWADSGAIGIPACVASGAATEVL